MSSAAPCRGPLPRAFSQRLHCDRESARQLIDSRAGRDRLREVVTKIEASGTVLTPEESKILYDLTDFLSFFEFIAFLRDAKALKLEDCQALFHYYLELLRQDFLMEFMKRYHYTLLLRLLDAVAASSSARPAGPASARA